MSNQDIIKKKISEVASEGRLSCKEAFKIASELECETSRVGQACNELKIKIINCQLGCF